METKIQSDHLPIRVALVGLGKMGLSHQAIINMHPRLQLVAVCDSATYLLDVIKKYTGIAGYTDFCTMLDQELPDAVVIATPSSLHEQMVSNALKRNIHVFCEKPFCLNIEEGARLVIEAERRGLVNQVGYHNRFLSTFEEARKLISLGVIGEVYHAKVECYGPVVLKPKGVTWRSSERVGGGCLYDYASHGIDLIHFLIGQPDYVSGSTLKKVFSSEAEDEVYANLHYSSGRTAQISANWSDDSFRKMTTTISIWGNRGKIIAGRQEVNLYISEGKEAPPGFHAGWTTIYTTSLTKPVGYYLRGEEYSAQIEHFVECITHKRKSDKSDFRSAYATDVVADWIRTDSRHDDPQPSDKIKDRVMQEPIQNLKNKLTSLGAGFRAMSR